MDTNQALKPTMTPFYKNYNAVMVESLRASEANRQQAPQSPGMRRFTRRGFIKTACVVTGSLVALDTLVFPKNTEASFGLATATYIFAEAVLIGAGTRVGQEVIDYILERIRRARVIRSPQAKTFHQYFNDPKQLDLVESPVRTIYDYYFGIDRRSQTCPENPILPEHDLNILEMLAITDKTNRANYAPNGSPFVPYPVTPRKSPDDAPEAADQFYHTSMIYDRFEIHPQILTLNYIREFSNNYARRIGYHVSLPNSQHEQNVSSPNRPPAYQAMLLV